MIMMSAKGWERHYMDFNHHTQKTPKRVGPEDGVF